MQTISVAMTTYNGTAYLAEQIGSLLAQTVLPDEIVVCDDRSTDGTPELVDSLAATSPVPIRLHRNAEQLGWRGNFIKAASLCSGNLIAFCDQDDVWAPTKLERVRDCFQNPDVLLAYHNAEVTDAALKPFGTLSSLGAPQALSPALSLSPWLSLLGFTMTFHKSLLAYWPLWADSIDKHWPGKPAAHDQWVYGIASGLGSVAYLAEPLAKYRQHAGNTAGISLSENSRRKLLFFLRSRDRVALQAEAAENRRDLFGRMAALTPERRGACEAAARHYAAYAALLGRQARLYGSGSLPRRLGAFGRLVTGSAYKGGDWALSRPMLVKDFGAALMGPGSMAALLARLERSP